MDSELSTNPKNQFITSIMLKLNSQARQLANKDQVINSLEMELQDLLSKQHNIEHNTQPGFYMMNQWIHKSVPGLG